MSGTAQKLAFLTELTLWNRFDDELVAGSDAAFTNSPGREFEDGFGFGVYPPDSPWANMLPGAEDAVLPVKGDDVDGEEHAKGMDAGGRSDEESGLWTDAAFAQKAEEAQGECVGEQAGGADGRRGGCVRDDDPAFRTHSGGALATHDDGYKNDGEEDACDDPDDDCCIHTLLLAKVGLR